MFRKRTVLPTDPIYDFNAWWAYIEEQIRLSKTRV